MYKSFIIDTTNANRTQAIEVYNFQLRLLKEEQPKASKTKEDLERAVETNKIALRNILPQKLIPSVILFSRCAISTTKTEVSKKHKNKLLNLSKEQYRPIFNVFDTVKMVALDKEPPRYVIDTLALGANNSIIDKSNPKEMLAELEILLKSANTAMHPQRL